MSQAVGNDIQYRSALASIKMLNESAVLDLTVEDYNFLTQDKLWLPSERSRARRCVESTVFGALDFVGFPRFPAPVEFIAAAIAIYVHPVNMMAAAMVMEGAEFTENCINGVERPVKSAELFSHIIRIRADDTHFVDIRDRQLRNDVKATV